MLSANPDFNLFDPLSGLINVDAARSMSMTSMANLWCMLNIIFLIETDCGKRAYPYVDSDVLSANLAD